MKKVLAIVLSVLMLVSLTACGGEKAPAKLEGVSAPVDVLSTVWGSYADDEKFFAMGGDYENMVDNAPGAVDVTNAETMQALLVCPADAAAMVDGAASLIHGMIANNFTAGAYHIKDGADQAAFVTAMQTAVKGNQWMCGFPEKLMIATLASDYVVVAFGAGDIIETFKTKLTAAYDVTVLAVEEALA
ncbi:MAG: hypothetical protein E7553_00225 [Ruminococcaceae bacterium]|nr:hypothetical protein [Oscillospiraceae bacterium]